ncbi:DUF6538 domain-containing protein [Palleronia abyssalis]|uniref:DUF6538 domain-containing protein n=1 Tax=Palleronia abyssalis TaxID=1501240 RepID=A0A2R8BX22_9RHOB|nr:DUF6538 domain-containing protein [Palleronia abyssalis]SPJ24683.1 hypothetical protein PAA8504_02521 [Palleronia abyssalis]
MAEYRTAPRAFVKAGVFYFSRRVPKDLQQHYSSSRVSFSLRTKSATVATSRALRAAQKLDEYWYHLRVQQCDLPGKHLLRDQTPDRGTPGNGENKAESDAVELSEAVAIYLRLKGQNRPNTFKRAAERSCGYLIDICGNKSITRYTRKDANTFRDALIAKGLAGSSITRTFGTVRSIINFAAAEIGIDLNNPFAKVYFDRKAGVIERKPIPNEAIATIQSVCREVAFSRTRTRSL